MKGGGFLDEEIRIFKQGSESVMLGTCLFGMKLVYQSSLRELENVLFVKLSWRQ